MNDEDVTRRRVARVILIDLARRVLLIGGRNPEDGRVVWVMPGGGIEGEETVREAAARELHEETGVLLAASELEGPIWTRRHRFSWAGRTYAYEEWFVVARPAREVTITPFAFSPEEAQNHVGMRWFDVAELRDWPEATAPRRLAELLPGVLAGDPFAAPVDVGP